MAIHYRPMFRGNDSDLDLNSLPQAQLNDWLVKACRNEVMDALHSVNPLRIGSTAKVFFDNTEAQFSFIRALLDAGANAELLYQTDIVILAEQRNAVASAIGYSIMPVIEDYVKEHEWVLSLSSIQDVSEDHIPKEKRGDKIIISKLLNGIGSLLRTTASCGSIKALQCFEAVMPQGSLVQHAGGLFEGAVIDGIQNVKRGGDGNQQADYASYLLSTYPQLVKYLDLDAGVVRDISSKLNRPDILKSLSLQGYDLFKINPAFAEFMLKEQNVTPLQYLKSVSDPDNPVIKSAAYVYLKKNKMTPYALIDKIGNAAIEKQVMALLLDKVIL